jgi:hypothetical protein
MTEVLNKLTEREREKHYAEKEAAARIREAEVKVTEATEGLQELKRTQEQELRVLKVKNDKKIRDASFAARGNVLKAQKESAQGKAVAEAAEQRKRRSEAHVAHLEAKVKDLRAKIERRNQASDVECSRVQHIMDSRFERVAAQADGRIRSMAEHAKEVCAATGASLQTVASELQDQMLRASLRAEGRTRFKELRELSKVYDNVTLTKDSFEGMRNDLIELWHLQARAQSPVGMFCDTPSFRSASPFRTDSRCDARSPSPPSELPGLAKKSLLENFTEVEAR